MDLRTGDKVFPLAGFPHSDIRGSSVICTYPRLFAACHVLLRLLVPGHPPCALSSLTLVLLNDFSFIKSSFLYPSKIEILKTILRNTFVLLVLP